MGIKPRQPAYPGKVVERCGLSGNKRDLTFDAPLIIKKEYSMSNICNFIDYRLTHDSRPKPRCSRYVQLNINLLHDMRLRYDRFHLYGAKQGRHHARRTYYQLRKPGFYADRTPAQMNDILSSLRENAKPGMVLDFYYDKKVLDDAIV